MKSRWTGNGLFAATVFALSVVAFAQTQPQAVTAKGGESGLVGIKLYDTGTRVLSVYGNPNSIEPVSFGGGTIGPTAGGGGARGGGGRAGGGGPAGPAGGGMGSPVSDAQYGPDTGFEFGDEMLKFQRGQDDDMPGRPGQGGVGPPPGVGPQGPPPGVGVPGAPGGGAPGGRGMGGGVGTGSKILYTRWVYRRGPSRYGFILDKFNRVVQCEAIGMNDGKVRTSKGIKFGSTFKDVMNKYKAPDGYEISGDNIVMRYLVRNKVAFRLSRLGEKKPHVVTGIVVAGGKT